MSSDYRFSGNKNDPLKRINKIAQSISVRRTGFNDANFRGKQFEDTDQEFNPGPVAEQLTEWKDDFNGKLQHIQEEILLYITQRHISNEELALLIRNTISELKMSVSELLNTMALLIKKFIKRSKKLVQNSNQYWQQIVLDLNNQLEYVSRARAIEADKRKELERENKQLKQQLRIMRLEAQPKVEFESLLESQITSNSPIQLSNLNNRKQTSTTNSPTLAFFQQEEVSIPWENQLRSGYDSFPRKGFNQSNKTPQSARSSQRSPRLAHDNQDKKTPQSARNQKLSPRNSSRAQISSPSRDSDKKYDNKSEPKEKNTTLQKPKETRNTKESKIENLSKSEVQIPLNPEFSTHLSLDKESESKDVSQSNTVNYTSQVSLDQNKLNNTQEIKNDETILNSIKKSIPDSTIQNNISQNEISEESNFSSLNNKNTEFIPQHSNHPSTILSTDNTNTIINTQNISSTTSNLNTALSLESIHSDNTSEKQNDTQKNTPNESTSIIDKLRARRLAKNDQETKEIKEIKDSQTVDTATTSTGSDSARESASERRARIRERLQNRSNK